MARIQSTVKSFDPEAENRYFVFGSSVRKDRFGDIDIGVVGNSRARKNLSALRENFENSTLPYFVDVVDFDAASKDFSTHVRAREPIIWLN